MEEPNQLTDITLVIYPSNHVLKDSPKIALLGKGKDWKDEVVKHTNNYWTETPVMFFYVDDEENTYDSDTLSWLYLNVKNCDFIIGRITQDVDDLSVVAPYAKENTTFLVYENVNMDLQSWFETINPNRKLATLLAIVLGIKDNWKKSIKYKQLGNGV